MELLKIQCSLPLDSDIHVEAGVVGGCEGHVLQKICYIKGTNFQLQDK